MTGAGSGGEDPGAARVLAFLHEVAGGRRLTGALRERADEGASIHLAAPQNQPVAGQIVDQDELREAAWSRVEVTREVLGEFGVDAEGAVMDPDPPLALDDAVRAFAPTEILISCLAGTRFGLMRKDLVEWARKRFDVPVVHVQVRIGDDAVRWDVTHTLVVATQTVASDELIGTLKRRAAERPHRYTIISPASGQISRDEVCERLARCLAALYHEEIDATGQPMSPAPLAAVKNAIEHYRIDDILISTFAGEQSKWVEQGLIDEVRALTDKTVEHLEVEGSQPTASSASRPGAVGSVAG